MEELGDFGLSSIVDVKKLSLDVLIQFAIFQALRAQLVNPKQYHLAIKNIESIMVAELKKKVIEIRTDKEGKEIKCTYFDIIKDEDERINKKYGNPVTISDKQLEEVATAHFQLLMEIIEKKFPILGEGET